MNGYASILTRQFLPVNSYLSIHPASIHIPASLLFCIFRCQTKALQFMDGQPAPLQLCVVTIGRCYHWGLSQLGAVTTGHRFNWMRLQLRYNRMSLFTGSNNLALNIL